MLIEENSAPRRPFPGDAGAALLLALLLCGDLVFIALHCLKAAEVLSSPLLSLEKDKGYAEVYQYLKFLWITLMLGYVASAARTPGYAAWGMLFTYLLCDDALQIHERVGERFAAAVDFPLPFNLLPNDVGQLMVSVAAAAFLFPIVAWAYLRGRPEFKRASRDLLLLVFLLAFFGVVVDMVHSACRDWPTADFVLAIVEDGSELAVVSVVVWYVFALSVSRGEPVVDLCGGAGRLLLRQLRGLGVSGRTTR